MKKKVKEKKPKKIPLRKNVSQKIKNGTVLYTRDEYFEDNNGYIKPKYKDNDKHYRDAIVVDSNRKGQLAVIKTQSGGKRTVKNKAGQKEKYNPIIKTKDNNGNPIEVNEKFVRGYGRFGVTEKDANKMKKQSIKHPNRLRGKENRKKLRELKKRDP